MRSLSPRPRGVAASLPSRSESAITRSGRANRPRGQAPRATFRTFYSSNDAVYNLRGDGGYLETTFAARRATSPASAA